MVSTVGYFGQQTVANTLLPKGDDLQKQQLQRSGQEAQATSQNPSTGPQAQPTGAPAAQGEGSQNETNKNPTQLDVSEFSAQSTDRDTSPPPRGSYVDISA